MQIKQSIIKSILDLPRSIKQIIAIFCDLNLCVICVVLAYYLRLEEFVSIKGSAGIAVVISVCMALPIFWFTRLYRSVFRYSGLNIVLLVSVSVFVYGLAYFSIITLYKIDEVPRSIGVLQPMLLFFMIILSRLFVKYIFIIDFKKKFLKKTLIYGAGNAGRQLATSLYNSYEFKVVGFLDDDEKLWNQFLDGIKIYNPNNLEKIIQFKDIDLVLLALPSVTRFRRNQILEKISKYKLKVQTLPSVMDIVDGKVTLTDIKELDINDVLNREPVPPKQELLNKNIKDQVVLVTGAGGSIGSELCRQIIKIKPKVLVLCELNEFALYKIYEELKIINQKLKIIPLLVNVQNENKINKILKIFKVKTIYHSAAYKHVPLVETNICEGVMNNVFGTYSIASCAMEQCVENFVLISSDKAVRPTNIMGATKRLSELCLQALYNHYHEKNINMSIVRFGNVLDSSGSVIPKFKKQIKEGGPITLTHPEVTRYFMTITEAAQLVIQAGAMSKNCDVFILDMGNSIKIIDMINRIINLSGLSVKNEKQPDGDIEIKIIGLRPGEKLYEELLLGVNPQPTAHEKIQKAKDPYLPFGELKKDLDVLKLLSANDNAIETKQLLEKMIDLYQSEYEIVDYMHLEELGLQK